MASFSIYPRKRKNGKPVNYAQFKQSDGKYTTAKSTGCTTRQDAIKRCEDELLRNGTPFPGRDITFGDYSKNFFDWNGAWVTDKRVRGQRIGLAHCLYTAKTLKIHVLPVFGELKLSDIDKLKIRNFRNSLYQQGYSGSLINKALYAIKIILDAAEDQGLIKAVPKIEKAADRPKKKGILSIDEVRKLFSSRWESIPSYSHPTKERFIGYVGNLLACVTGLRLGELQGLLLSDLRLDEGYITVKRSWNRMINCLNETTKNGRERNILIPSYVSHELKQLVDRNPNKRPESFLFFSVIENQPIDSKVFIKAFFEALSRIGIDEVERRRRNITFHSHRHWFNSLLLNAKVPLQKVQQLTGHLSPEMSQLYYHVDNLQDVRQIQESIFSAPIEAGTIIN